MVFKGFRDWNLLPALLGDTSTGQFQLLDIMSRSEKKTITIKKKISIWPLYFYGQILSFY